MRLRTLPFLIWVGSAFIVLASCENDENRSQRPNQSQVQEMGNREVHRARLADQARIAAQDTEQKAEQQARLAKEEAKQKEWSELLANVEAVANSRLAKNDRALACKGLYFECVSRNPARRVFNCTKDSAFDYLNTSPDYRSATTQSEIWKRAACDLMLPKLDAMESKLVAKQKRKEEAKRTISVSALSRAFDENELAANDRYVDKKFIITGIVVRVSESLGNVIVELAGGPSGSELLQVSESAESAAEKLRRGQRVALDCLIRGSAITGLLLEDCSFPE